MPVSKFRHSGRRNWLACRKPVLTAKLTFSHCPREDRAKRVSSSSVSHRTRDVVFLEELSRTRDLTHPIRNKMAPRRAATSRPVSASAPTSRAATVDQTTAKSQSAPRGSVVRDVRWTMSTAIMMNAEQRRAFVREHKYLHLRVSARRASIDDGVLHD